MSFISRAAWSWKLLSQRCVLTLWSVLGSEKCIMGGFKSIFNPRRFAPKMLTNLFSCASTSISNYTVSRSFKACQPGWSNSLLENLFCSEKTNLKLKLFSATGWATKFLINLFHWRSFMLLLHLRMKINAPLRAFQGAVIDFLLTPVFGSSWKENCIS